MSSVMTIGLSDGGKRCVEVWTRLGIEKEVKSRCDLLPISVTDIGLDVDGTEAVDDVG